MHYFWTVFKLAFWGSTSIFLAHLALVCFKEKPEQFPLVNGFFLEYAKACRYNFQSMVLLMTRPACESLLMPRPELPPGYQEMKVLVLNLSGTLVHTEYKVSNKTLI